MRASLRSPSTPWRSAETLAGSESTSVAVSPSCTVAWTSGGAIMGPTFTSTLDSCSARVSTGFARCSQHAGYGKTRACAARRPSTRVPMPRWTRVISSGCSRTATSAAAAPGMPAIGSPRAYVTLITSPAGVRNALNPPCLDGWFAVASRSCSARTFTAAPASPSLSALTVTRTSRAFHAASPSVMKVRIATTRPPTRPACRHSWIARRSLGRVVATRSAAACESLASSTAPVPAPRNLSHHDRIPMRAS
jgi:hypothetical protein